MLQRVQLSFVVFDHPGVHVENQVNHVFLVPLAMISTRTAGNLNADYTSREGTLIILARFIQDR
jgi:hypothetical protein